MPDDVATSNPCSCQFYLPLLPSLLLGRHHHSTPTPFIQLLLIFAFISVNRHLPLLNSSNPPLLPFPFASSFSRSSLQSRALAMFPLQTGTNKTNSDELPAGCVRRLVPHSLPLHFAISPSSHFSLARRAPPSLLLSVPSAVKLGDPGDFRVMEIFKTARRQSVESAE